MFQTISPKLRDVRWTPPTRAGERPLDNVKAAITTRAAVAYDRYVRNRRPRRNERRF